MTGFGEIGNVVRQLYNGHVLGRALLNENISSPYADDSKLMWNVSNCVTRPLRHAQLQNNRKNSIHSARIGGKTMKKSAPFYMKTP